MLLRESRRKQFSGVHLETEPPQAFHSLFASRSGQKCTLPCDSIRPAPREFPFRSDRQLAQFSFPSPRPGTGLSLPSFPLTEASAAATHHLGGLFSISCWTFGPRRRWFQ